MYMISISHIYSFQKEFSEPPAYYLPLPNRPSPIHLISPGNSIH